MISETLISRAAGPDFTQAAQKGVGATTRSASEHQGQPDFGDLLRSTIGQVDRLEKQAQVAVQGLMSGTGIDVHQALIAAEKANAAFELALAMRNKAVQSYQSVMSMQF